MKYNQIVNLKRMEDIRRPKLGIRDRIIRWLFKADTIVRQPVIEEQDIEQILKQPIEFHHSISKIKDNFVEQTNLPEEDRIRLLFDNIKFKENGCWEWAGGCSGSLNNKYRYPAFWNGIRNTMVSKFFYQLFFKKDIRITNTCGNRLCVNPMHYKEMNVGDALDIFKKGLIKKTKLSKKRKNKLSKSLIEEIRNQAESGVININDLAPGSVINVNGNPAGLKVCKHGHLMTEENTLINDRGYKECKACKRIWRKQYYLKNQEREKANSRRRHQAKKMLKLAERNKYEEQ